MDKETPSNDPPLPFLPLSSVGFDAHAFASNDGEEKALWLCHVKIPHHPPLLGVSDADVALHALTDALLGLAAEGDIGVHFPPDNPKWKNACSVQFVQKGIDFLNKKRIQLTHIDLTLICETPKISLYREEMRQSLAKILPLPKEHISVKASTTEKMGFTGRKEGIVAIASASAVLPL